MLIATTGPAIWQKSEPWRYAFLNSLCNGFVKIIPNQGFRWFGLIQWGLSNIHDYSRRETQCKTIDRGNLHFTGHITGFHPICFWPRQGIHQTWVGSLCLTRHYIWSPTVSQSDVITDVVPRSSRVKNCEPGHLRRSQFPPPSSSAFVRWTSERRQIKMSHEPTKQIGPSRLEINFWFDGESRHGANPKKQSLGSQKYFNFNPWQRPFLSANIFSTPKRVTWRRISSFMCHSLLKPTILKWVDRIEKQGWWSIVT